jgi:hypothetical protein
VEVADNEKFSVKQGRRPVSLRHSRDRITENPFLFALTIQLVS